MKQTLVRALLSIAKLTQGFEVGLAICSPLAYVGASALTALYHSMYHLDPPASPTPSPVPDRGELTGRRPACGLTDTQPPAG